MAWRERLRKAVHATGLSQSEIARRSGIAPETLSRILRANMNPQFETVVKITHACGETVGWVMEAPGYELSRTERLQLQRIAVFLRTILARMARVDSLKHPNAILEHEEIPRAAVREGARMTFRAVGESMREAIQPGDMLYVRPQSSWKRASGCVAVVMIHGKHYAKRLTVEGEIVTLTSTAEGHTTIIVNRREPAVELVGVVVTRGGLFL